ncbi:DgyrCDS6742 [Dimorphilus gyrociliatus]|uniref:DgyrCDS6742 n=1 Tax=Dimorphilus gyrociliatus TaxID=2664684 RepID=A0A7I8VP23_9ANNE|nr:DgyrCDS6742 [Dimorphilus gyrociliatus]
MADEKIEDEECLRKGTKVSVRCRDGREKTGEVVAFDPQNQILVLRRKAHSGKQHLFDIDMINMQFLESVSVVEEAKGDFDLTIDFAGKDEIDKRIQRNVEYKRTESRYVGLDVTPVGQNLCNYIRKTLEDVSWQEKSLLVFNGVKISPPYGPENVGIIPTKAAATSKGNDHALSHVRKIVEKFHKEKIC